MQINITGKNMKITKALRDFVNKKIKKVIVDFERPIDCEVILSVEKNNRHIAELIISGDSNKFYFKKESKDLYGTIEEVVHAADLKIKKFKERQKDKNRKKRNFLKTEGRKGSNVNTKNEVNIKTEDISNIKPMSIEEAILELKFLNNFFIIFRNSKNFHTYLLYKEKNSKYYNIILPYSGLLNRLFNKKVKSTYLNMQINFNNGKLKIISKNKLSLDVLSMNHAVTDLKSKKTNFIIFLEKSDNDSPGSVVLLYKKSRNTFGRYFLHA